MSRTHARVWFGEDTYFSLGRLRRSDHANLPPGRGRGEGQTGNDMIDAVAELESDPADGR